jgi:hypothetical protein
MRAALWLPLAVCILFATGGCDSSSPAGLPTVKMQIGSRSFVIEVARTSAQQEKGLMQRDSMPPDHGMIFIFPDDQLRQFWMRNTRIPLDILFLDVTGRIVSIHQMKPYDESQTSSDFPARYAIELNQGSAATTGVRVGDQLQVPESARSGPR